MKSINRLLLVVIASLMVSACSTNSGKTVNYYQFTTPVLETEMQQVESLPLVVIHPISMPEFYQGSGIVIRQNDIQAVAANWHMWAQPPQQMLAQHTLYQLRQNLPTVLTVTSDEPWLRGIDDSRVRLAIRIDIQHFNGTNNGNATIRGHWTLLNKTQAQDQVISIQHFSVESELTGDGYPALVNALQNAWSQVNQQIQTKIEQSL